MQEVQVSFRRPGEGRLSAHLWLPPGEGSFPAVILVAPAEEGDRALAHLFAEEGFGAVRVDLGLSTSGRPSEAIRAAIDFIDEEEPRINRRAIGLLASGAQVLPALRCASVDHRVRALVLLRPILDEDVLRLAERVDLPLCLLAEDEPEALEEARLFADTYAGPVDIVTLPPSGRSALAEISAASLSHFLRSLDRRKARS
jgi:hypothetical protein